MSDYEGSASNIDGQRTLAHGLHGPAILAGRRPYLGGQGDLAMSRAGQRPLPERRHPRIRI